MTAERRTTILKTILIVVAVYVFLLSINLLGHSFKLFGKGFAEAMLRMTSNPFAGLFIGAVATALIQSSSTTTSIVVGLVAGDAISLGNAVPIIMGANIGTTVTNTLVSIGHISSRVEFKRAFTASVVHDFFNVCAVIVLFPIELKFHLLEKMAIRLEGVFAGAGGLRLFNPLKLVVKPVIKAIDWAFAFLPYHSIFMVVFSLALMFTALVLLVRTMRSLVLAKVEVIVNRYLFRNDLLSFGLGISMTSIVQSSSVTTSLVVPLAGAGLISVRQIFPYTLGANIGTTVTAILAAMTTQNHVAVTVAFSHLCFNILGILIFYPLRIIPIGIAEFVGERAAKSVKNFLIFATLYILIFLLPLALVFVT